MILILGKSDDSLSEWNRGDGQDVSYVVGADDGCIGVCQLFFEADEGGSGDIFVCVCESSNDESFVTIEITGQREVCDFTVDAPWGFVYVFDK